MAKKKNAKVEPRDSIHTADGERLHRAGLRLGLIDEGLRYLHEHIRQRLVGMNPKRITRARLQSNRSG